MLLPYTTLTYYGPAALAIEVEGGGEDPVVDVHGFSRIGINVEGGGVEPDLHATLLVGWGVEIEGLGEVEAFGLRGNIRLGIDVDVAAQPTVFDIVQGVLNAQAAQYNLAGTVGNKINSAGSGGVDLNALADAVWANSTRTLTAGAAPSEAQIADAVWDVVVENGLSARQITRLMAAVLAGKVSGAGTDTLTFAGIDGVTPRVVGSVDAQGNRTAVLLDGE
jgi:hypothetical protein